MRDMAKKQISDARWHEKCWRRSVKVSPEVYSAMAEMREQTGMSFAKYIMAAVQEKYGKFPLGSENG